MLMRSVWLDLAPWVNRQRRELAGAGLRVVVFEAAFVIVLGCGYRTPPNNHANARPALAFTPEAIDLGTTKDRSFERRLSIHNQSDASVRINSVEKSCSCTVADLPVPCDIPPGGDLNLFVQARYRETDRGFASHEIRFHCDDPIKSVYVIRVSATLEGEPKVTLLPEVLNFGKFGSWERPYKDVRVSYAYGSSLAVTSILTSRPGLTTSLVGKDRDGSLIYRIWVPEDLKIGPFDESLNFQTTAGSASLPVRGEKLGVIYALPKNLMCDDGKLPVRKSVLLLHSPSCLLQSVSVSSDLGEVKVVDTSPVGSGKTKVVISLESVRGQLPVKGVLRIHTELDQNPVVVGFIVLKGSSSQQD